MSQNFHPLFSSRFKRTSVACTLTLPLVFSSAAVASAQEPAPSLHQLTGSELPGYGKLPDVSPDAFLGVELGESNRKMTPLAPEQQGAANNSILNNLPENPGRADGAGTLVDQKNGSMMVGDRLWDAKTIRYSYKSTDSLGNASVDTAIYLEPNRPWKGEGPRPVVAIAPGTQGAGPHCDPSNTLESLVNIRLNPFDIAVPYEVVPLVDHLARGAAVIMIDHHRDANGQQAYMDNIASGQSLLDAVVAARGLGAAADAPVGIYGYSQGGSSAAAAADRAGVYAPEVNVVATSAGGGISNVEEFSKYVGGSVNAALLPLAIDSMLEKDPALKEAFFQDLTPEGQQVMNDVSNYCVGGAAAHYMIEDSKKYTKDGVPLADLISRYEPLKREVARQTIGKFVPNAPVYLYHSPKDDIVPIDQFRAVRDAWTANGFTELTWKEDNVPAMVKGTVMNHVAGMLVNLPSATDFIWSHFPSKPARIDLAL